MKKSDWAFVLALAVCALTLAACGSSADGNGGDAASKEEATLAFAECMREHGVEMEDPQPGQSIEVGSQDDPRAKQALAACDDKLGSQELSSEEDEELKEGALAFAQCMREEGIDMGDPVFLGPGKFHFDIAGLDTTSPAFEAAQEACKGRMPELDIVGVGG